MRKNTLKNNRVSNLFHPFVHVNCVFIYFCVLKIFLINFNILIFYFKLTFLYFEIILILKIILKNKKYYLNIF